MRAIPIEASVLRYLRVPLMRSTQNEMEFAPPHGEWQELRQSLPIEERSADETTALHITPLVCFKRSKFNKFPLISS